jgi:hypothetical protein
MWLPNGLVFEAGGIEQFELAAAQRRTEIDDVGASSASRGKR